MSSKKTVAVDTGASNIGSVTEFLNQERKLPFLTADQAYKIANVYQTPFHIYHEGYLREIVGQVYQAFSWNQGYREFFAVKANPNFAILKILFEEGCGFDCSSEAELLLAYAVGARGPQIMFTSNDTPLHEFIMAVKLGATITLDDITHIEYVRQAAELAGCKFPETISIRWNPGGTFSAGNGIMGNPEEAKYGMTNKQVYAAVNRLKDLGVKHFGLHAFLASNTLGEAYYGTLAAKMFKLVQNVSKVHDVHFEFVNLSGGVGIPYEPGQKPNDIFKISQLVRENYQTIITDKGSNLRIFTEMGRFITGPFGGLVSKVIHMKNTHRHYAGLDASASDLMRPAIYGAYHHITILGKEFDPPCGIAYDITGPLCENNDKFAVKRTNLPPIQIGDLCFIHDTGAHGYAMGYNYNARLRHSELLLQTDGRVRLIRRAETIKDYLRTNLVNEDLRKALQNDDLIMYEKTADYDLNQPKFCLGNIYTYTPACDILDSIKG